MVWLMFNFLHGNEKCKINHGQLPVFKLWILKRFAWIYCPFLPLKWLWTEHNKEKNSISRHSCAIMSIVKNKSIKKDFRWWLFRLLCLITPLRIFHCQWGAAKFGICLAFKAFEQGGSFIMSYFVLNFFSLMRITTPF